MFFSPTVIVQVMSIFAFAAMVPLTGLLSHWIVFNVLYAYPDSEYDPFNFLSFFNLVGFLAIFIFGMGWGNIIRIDTNRIHRPYKTLKTILAYLTAPLVALASSVVLLIPGLLLSSHACVSAALNLFLQARAQPLATQSMNMFFHENVHLFNNCSSYAITGTLFFLACVMILWSLFCVYSIWSLCDALRQQLVRHGYAISLEFSLILSILVCYASYRFIAISGLVIIASAIEIFSYYLGA